MMADFKQEIVCWKKKKWLVSEDDHTVCISTGKHGELQENSSNYRRLLGKQRQVDLKKQQ
jgi:hypothetical protein